MFGNCKVCERKLSKDLGQKYYCSHACWSEDKGIKSSEIDYAWDQWRFKGRTLASIAKELGHTYPNLGIAIRRKIGKEAVEWGPKFRAEQARKQVMLLSRFDKYDETFTKELLDYYAKPGIRLHPDVVDKFGMCGNTIRKLAERYLPDRWAEIAENKAVEFVKMYPAGKRFEYRARDVLRKRGYWVLRSPGSRGPVDLVAIKKGEVLLVQCKLNGQISNRDKDILSELAESIGAKAVLALRLHGEVIFKPLVALLVS